MGGIIEQMSQASGSSKSPATSIMRGTIVDVRTDGLVSVQIPRYLSTEVIGPMPSAVADLDPGDSVLIGTVGAAERMVISLADGTQNWLQQPDLTVVPETGADLDLFKAKGVAMVTASAASGGDNFPTTVGGLVEAWTRDTGEQVQRYTDITGRVYVRSRIDPTPWSTWSSPTIVSADLSDATPVGTGVLTAANAAAARAALGLGNVANTSDTDKPLSSAMAAALADKASLNSPHFTGDVTGISKVHVGLDQVDNTPDMHKPISYPALARFAKVDEDIAAAQFAAGAGEPAITAGTTAQYWRGDKTWQALNKTAVGLDQVDNTSDLAKPVSSATQTALNGKAASVHTHAATDIVSGTLDSNRLPSIPAALLPAATITVQGAMSPTDKTKLDNAVSTATASRLVIRDASGRAAFASPSATGDAATKGYVDNLTEHRVRLGEAIAGTAPTATVRDNIANNTQGVMVQHGTSVITTDASGYYAFTYPTAFPVAVSSMVITNGDAVIGRNANFCAAPNSIFTNTLSTWYGSVVDGDGGAPITNTNCRIHWVAFGW